MPRHCVQMAKISRHSLNLKGKATTTEKENHRNGGKPGTPKPVEVKMKISNWKYMTGKKINFYYSSWKETKSVHLGQ